MVICPHCLQTTGGEPGGEITCAHCSTRFVPGQPLAKKPLQSPQKTPSKPRVSIAVILCALAPFVAPVAAFLAWLFIPAESVVVILPLVILLCGWLAGGIAIVAATKLGSRWRSVAGVGMLVSLLEIPLFGVLFIFIARASVMPGR